MKKRWNVDLKKNLKKGQTTISDRSKGILVVICFLVFLGFYFYRNLESYLKGFYASRNFRGDIQITGFSWTRPNAGPDVNFIYSETIEGKKVSIPLKKSVRFKHLVMPYYNKIDVAEKQVMENTYDEYDRAYLPILEKAIELSPDRHYYEAKLEEKMNLLDTFIGSSIEINSSPFKKRGDNYFSLIDNYKNGIPFPESKILGGWCEVPFALFIATGDCYIEISLPENRGLLQDLNHDFKSDLEKLSKKTDLPDGWYRLVYNSERVSHVVEIRDGEVKD